MLRLCVEQDHFREALDKLYSCNSHYARLESSYRESIQTSTSEVRCASQNLYIVTGALLR